jgi:RNA polymerase-binding transcription factor DksA
MTDARIHAARERLERIADELEADLRAEDPTAESIVPDCAIGGTTRMEAIQAQAVGNEGRRRQRERLAQVRHALARLAKGHYGTCERCGGPIAPGRLEAAPEATRCVPCAARD